MSILIMILLLSLLILVHEAGHFLAARAFGIKVEKFGFGLPIGPTLFKTKCGDTEVLIHAFLLGGYVSFPDDEKDSDLPADSPERFINKPLWQRAIVISAGVISNVICAILLVMFVAGFTKQLPSGDYEVSVKEIIAPKNASIWTSGLENGDKIIKANDCEIKNIYSLVTIVQNSAKGNGIVSQEAINKNYEALKALNPGLEKDEIIPKDLSVRLPEKPYADIIIPNDVKHDVAIEILSAKIIPFGLIIRKASFKKNGYFPFEASINTKSYFSFSVGKISTASPS